MAITAYSIRCSDMVRCLVRQDSDTGRIHQVVFTTDDGKGCPVTSSIGDVKGIPGWVKALHDETTENINLLDIWRQSNPVKPGEKP